MLKAREMLACM